MSMAKGVIQHGIFPGFASVPQKVKQKTAAAHAPRDAGFEKVAKILKDRGGQMPVLQHFTDEERIKLLPYFEYERLPNGAVYCREGDALDSLSIIASGRLEVKKESTLKGRHILCAVLERGSHIGSHSVGGRKSYGRVTALEDTELITLSGRKLQSFMEGYPYLGIKLLKGITAIQDIRLQTAMEKVVQLS